MKRKKQIFALVMLFALLCVFVLASCRTEKADYFNYTEANLGVMGKLVKLMHGWIGNYGWTVVVFTLFEVGNIAVGHAAACGISQDDAEKQTNATPACGN